TGSWRGAAESAKSATIVSQRRVMASDTRSDPASPAANHGADRATRHPSALLRAREIDALEPFSRTHQFNDNAVRITRTLGTLVGMQRIGVHIVRLAPGRESTQFHFHSADEEFLYVLAGRGIAEIGDAEYEVGPGDFMGFSAPSEPHALKNPFD